MPRIVTTEERNLRKLRGEAMRRYRTNMQIKLNEMAGKLSLCPTLYGRMETGNGPVEEEVFCIIQQMFNEWRIKKIEELENHIAELKLIE